MQAKYTIAGVILTVSYKHRYTEKLFENYIYNGDLPSDEVIEITKTDIDYELSLYPDQPEFYLENLAILRKVMDILVVKYNAMLFHGSSISYKGKAYVFTAPSGTGKSTHTRLLKELLGEDVEYINDDKPIIRVVGGKVLVYGSPWNGKHHLGGNVVAPLKAICLVNRGENNLIEKISPSKALTVLFEQSMGFSNVETAESVLDVLTEIVNKSTFYKLYCNVSVDAAKCSFEGMLYED